MLQYKTNSGARYEPTTHSNKLLKEANAILDELYEESEKQCVQYAGLDHIQTIDELERDVATLEKIIARLVFAERKIFPCPDYNSWIVDAPTPLTPETKDATQAATEWLQNHGCFIDDNVTISPGLPEGCGVVARKTIQPGTSILSIPRSLMLTADRFAHEPWYNALVDRVPILKSQPAAVLAVSLLVECHNAETSPLKPYLESLPKTFTSPFFALPCLSGSKLLKELRSTTMSLDTESSQPSPYVRLLRNARSTMRLFAFISAAMREARKFKGLPSGVLANVPLITFEQFRWATCTVMARQNFVPAIAKPVGATKTSHKDQPVQFKEGENVLALIPGFDALNHSAEAIRQASVQMIQATSPKLSLDEARRQAERVLTLVKTPEPGLTTGYDLETNASVTQSCLTAEAGNQVYTSYGTRANDDLYLFQGFVLPDHPLPRANIPLTFVNPSHPPSKLRSTILKRFDPNPAFYTSNDGQTKYVIELPQMYRIKKAAALQSPIPLTVAGETLTESVNWRELVLASLTDAQLTEALLATSPAKANELIQIWTAEWEAFTSADEASALEVVDESKQNDIASRHQLAYNRLGTAVEKSPILASLILPVTLPLLLLQSERDPKASLLGENTKKLIAQVLTYWVSVLGEKKSSLDAAPEGSVTKPEESKVDKIPNHAEGPEMLAAAKSFTKAEAELVGFELTAVEELLNRLSNNTAQK